MSYNEMGEIQGQGLQKQVSLLSQEMEAARIIFNQVVKLNTAENLDQAIKEMLEAAGSHLMAERIYIYHEQGEGYSNIYRWCAEGIQPQIKELQNLAKDDIALGVRTLEENKCVLISNVEDIRDSVPDIYQQLQKQNITCAIDAPIKIDNRLAGFIGVANVPDEFINLAEDSLMTLGSALGTLLQVKQAKTKIKIQNIELRQEQKQYWAALSNQCEYFYTFDVTEGLIYEEFVTAHGINLIKRLGLSLPASFDEMTEKYLSNYRVELLSPKMKKNFNCRGLLEQFEKGVTNAESEYYSPLTDVFSRVSTLMTRDEESGHVHAIVIATDTTEMRKKEAGQFRELLDAKEELVALNEELRTALSSEQQKTAVISAMSNIYYSSFLINMDDGIMSVISNVNYLEDCFVDGRKAQDALCQWKNEIMDEASAEELEQFIDLSTLSDRLRDTQIVNCDCISKVVGWIRVSFIAVDRDENGKLKRALWAGQRIDKEKQRELAQKEALQAAYEAANRANSAKTNFLASMSHDIRTPMNAIIGMTAIAGTHLDDKERVTDCLGKIAVSSKHLLRLINEVLDMSKIESGKLDLHDEEFSLSDLIDELLDMTKSQVKAKNQELVVSIRGIEHEKVIGDGQRIQQAFTNLMGNAIKYTPEGGRIALSISERPMNKPRVGCYEFIFEDNGIGMSHEFVDHIFEPFARATDSRVEKVQGTGLGMSITRSMVQMMNGDIKVESELNKGTKITVTIVLKLADVDESIRYEDFIDLPILVADDDEISCEYTCQILDEMGMKGEWVLSGREAVEAVVARHKEERDFFAVIIDWKMPEMDGIETTKAIRKRVGKEVPIIIISAYDWADIELEARAAGANAFISKPLFKSRMAHLFNNLLGHNNEEGREASLDAIVQKSFTGKRALLVEDNELNAEIAGEILGMAGLTVDYAGDGKEALDIMTAVSDDYYDIIFMDIQMPVMNGYDATVAIRALPREYTKYVPIIAMTANAFTEDIHAAQNAGMNQHMAKPLDFEQLMGVLHKWLD